MTLDDETAGRIAREVIDGGKATRVYPHSTDVALVRAGYAARDAEVEELRARLAKVREYITRLQTNRAQADLRAILDESPTERDATADAVATVVAAWRGVGKGPKITALSNLAAALDRLAEAAQTRQEETDDERATGRR